MSNEFCRHCGAGIGKFRRDGEGTCPKCDPPPRNMKKFDLSSFLMELIDKYPLCENCKEAGACHSPEICHHERL